MKRTFIFFWWLALLYSLYASGLDKETAERFFERVGQETNTCVIWPTRLKVGAKSKKDPHIRVGGYKAGVKQARKIISELLDEKCRR